MKRWTVALALLVAMGLPIAAQAGIQCRLAKAFDYLSPAQNIACAYEYLFELMS